MSVIVSEIKTPNQYDCVRLYGVTYPKFKVPLHSTFDGIKIIPEFNIDSLMKSDIVNLMKEDSFYDLVFLKNFGKCTVLKGLKDSTKEFNILCLLLGDNVCWLYLTNEEYANFLLIYNQENPKLNVKDKYNPFKIGKNYRIKNNFKWEVCKDYEIKLLKVQNSDQFHYKSIVTQNDILLLNNNDEFMVLEQQSLLADIDGLEQQSISFKERHIVVINNFYYILGIGKEFLGYIRVYHHSNNAVDEITE